MSITATQPGTSVRDQVSPEEWATRVELAAAYRLVAANGWDDLVFTHISAKVPGPEKHFLINPYGWLFEEITASSLVKIDLDGKPVMETPHRVNPAGFNIHAAVHAARTDAHCVLHTHTPAGIAVSARKEGLLPISQHSLFPHTGLAYHNYEGVALNEDERPRLVADLGQNMFMILRNHGLLTVGANVGEAFVAMYVLETACKIQTMAGEKADDLIMIDPRILAGAKAQAKQVTHGLGTDLVWPALLRRLDRLDPSYKD